MSLGCKQQNWDLRSRDFLAEAVAIATLVEYKRIGFAVTRRSNSPNKLLFIQYFLPLDKYVIVTFFHNQIFSFEGYTHTFPVFYFPLRILSTKNRYGVCMS